MKKIAGCVFFCLSVVCFCASAQASLVTLALEPALEEMYVGETVDFKIKISGLAGDLAVSVFDLNLNFSSTALSFVSVAFGDPTLGDQLDPSGTVDSVTSYTNKSAGVLNLYGLSLYGVQALEGAQADSFILGTVRLKAISKGSSDVGITLNTLGDAQGNSLTSYTSTVGASVAAKNAPLAGVLILLMDE